MTHDDTIEGTAGHTDLAVESSVKPRRIDAHYISHELQHLLHFEKGFPFTVKELLLRPGKVVREYLFDDRNKYVKPIVFLIFTSLIFTLIVSYLHIDYSLFDIGKIKWLQDKGKTKEISDWTRSHVGYTNLIKSLFVALWAKVIFRKHNVNLFEITLLLCYVSGEAILLLGVAVLVAQPLDSGLIALAGALIYVVYPVWAVGQFFGEKKSINYIKSLLTFTFGIGTYLMTLLLIAYLLKIAIP